jgi:hypothetical protein
VRILAEEYLSGVRVEELQQWHPHLTLSQVHGALSHYFDNKEAFDAEIAELTRLVEEFRYQRGESLLAKKLREMGKELSYGK